MNQLYARKRMLIIESELNRRRLAEDVASVITSLERVAGDAVSVVAVAGTVAGLLGATGAAPRAPAGQGWMRTAIDGFSAAASLWRAIKGR
jgi:hypothetical protein